MDTLSQPASTGQSPGEGGAVTTEEILDQIRKGLEAVAPARAAEFRKVKSPEDLDSLGLDSITTLELVDRLEKRLGVAFSDDFLMEMTSARDLVAAIQDQVA
jgi:acyl carrier protein